MVKTTKTILLLWLCVARVDAQKPVINSSIYAIWPTATECKISHYGGYLAFATDSKLMLQSSDSSWKLSFSSAYGYAVDFANNDHLAIIKKGRDSLIVQTLGKEHQVVIRNVRSYKTAQKGKAEWLIYQLNTEKKELVVQNLSSGKSHSYTKVVGYEFDPLERFVWLEQQISDSTQIVSRLYLQSGLLSAIWQGVSATGFLYTPDGKSVAFLANSNRARKGAVWYYHEGDSKAQMLPLENAANLRVDRLVGFDNTGNQLFFSLKQNKPEQKPNHNVTSVDIYSFKDARLQSQQLKQLSGTINYTYVVNLASHRVMQLTGENEHLLGFNRSINLPKDEFILVEQDKGGDTRNEWNWNSSGLTSVYLVSTADGARKCLCKDQPDLISETYRLSPNNKYVVYYDPRAGDYFSYSIATGITKNITKGAAADWISENSEDQPDSIYEVYPGYHWSKNDDAVFIRSKNDIYLAYPSGEKPVIRLTGNHSAAHDLTFNFAELPGTSDNTIDLSKPLLLKVLDRETRDEGFCWVTPNSENSLLSPHLLPYHMTLRGKARDAEAYTLTLESAESSPNWYLTKDFKIYTPLTDIHPEKAYNWLTSKLVHFKTPDGKATQGVLFKPENFDPKKKYPVIFEYYERNIVGLHDFEMPSFSDGSRIDIPTYVSNGYLVFTPDIYYNVGHPGQSACNTILAAAKYLSQFAWVDSTKMGLMGHSFGGFETNYVITHSHLFAAAISMSGMSDYISAYGSIIGDGSSRQRQYELYRDRIGATPWQRPDLYVENSPLLKADQVTTPVLLMANKKDDDVPYEQGFEFFTALRRLQKKAWLLQYDNGGHQDWTDEKDLSLRMQQFFDYYLKGKTPPKWMVSGIPATDKQIDSGFEADTTGSRP